MFSCEGDYLKTIGGCAEGPCNRVGTLTLYPDEDPLPDDLVGLDVYPLSVNGAGAATLQPSEFVGSKGQLIALSLPRSPDDRVRRDWG